VSLTETKSELETLSNKVDKVDSELQHADKEESALQYNKKLEVRRNIYPAILG